MARDYPPRPLVGIGAVVFRGEQVLLIRRAKPPRQGEWSLPGGLQKLGETVFAGACREVMEETGIVIRPVGIVDVVDLIERDEATGAIRYHYTLIDVAALWQAGEAVAASDAADAAWVGADDLEARVAWSETVRIIDEARLLCATGAGAG
ncbi:MAG: NUDIX hydrolase [Rhodospirillales bacterium]|nr:NUDIX hydrolase [Rhodospirillales bacterium]